MDLRNDAALRETFATWVRLRMADLGIQEDSLGLVLAQPAGWLARFEENKEDLAWVQAWRVIIILGGDPVRVVGSMLAGDIPDPRK